MALPPLLYDYIMKRATIQFTATFVYPGVLHATEPPPVSTNSNATTPMGIHTNTG